MSDCCHYDEGYDDGYEAALEKTRSGDEPLPRQGVADALRVFARKIAEPRGDRDLADALCSVADEIMSCEKFEHWVEVALEADAKRAKQLHALKVAA